MVPFRAQPTDVYYNLLADGFKAGELGFLVKPHPALLTLKDPYDPVQNGPYRLHDATLYKGKFYLYFGPVPALVLFLPLIGLFNFIIRQDISVVIFLSGGFIFSVLILRVLLHKRWQEIPIWAVALSILTLGVSNFSTTILLRPGVWEVAITCGFFFAMGAFYFFSLELRHSEIRTKTLALGSLFAGLALGSRPSYVLLAPVLFVLSILLFRGKSQMRVADFFKIFSALWIPFSVCVMMLLWYNYARFGSPFEFGASYQLTGVKPNEAPIFYPEFFLTRLFHFLFTSFDISGSFPFFFLKGEPFYTHEPELGSLFMNPVLISSIPLLFLLFKENRQSDLRHETIFGVVMFSFGCFVVVFLARVTGICTRYHLDFDPFWLVVTLFVWLVFSFANPSRPLIGRVVRYLGALAIVFACLVGMALGHSEIPPGAVNRFYLATAYHKVKHYEEAEELYKEAIRLAPDFALAQSRYSLLLATQWRGQEAREMFADSIRTNFAVLKEHEGRSYIRPFQSLGTDPEIKRFYQLFGLLISKGLDDEAFATLTTTTDLLSKGGRKGDLQQIFHHANKAAAEAGRNDLFARIGKLAASIE
jgi:tetratricopeptide (TPR) repeat protein